MQLTIVIPVLNEEGSVEKVARDCLDSRDLILEKTALDAVEVVVVSDGSTDRTVEIAQSIEGVTTVVFEKNKGYGAAIQRGWEEKPAEFLGFLDGDGTCDAAFFADLVNALDAKNADVALGSRMGPESEMPRIRRVGNWLFAMLLGVLSRQSVKDSASGMRVVKRDALRRLLPLPAGLHFTPAMSARAMIGEIPIVELPMDYRERVGKSKLKVVQDGFRFLGVILSAAAFIRPSRLTLPFVLLLFAASVAMGLNPLLSYLDQGRLEEWMIYRFILISLIANIGVTIFSVTMIAEHVIAVGLLKYENFVAKAPWWWGASAAKAYVFISALLLIPAFILVWPGITSYAETGTILPTTMHWSRPIVAAFLGLSFVQFLASFLLTKLIASISERQSFLVGESN